MNKAMIVTISNRKGGVGKTTLAIALAETFVFEQKKNTLIIDLDPQSSASEILMSKDAYASALENDRTIPGLLAENNNDDYHSILSHACHSLTGRGSIDLAVAPNCPQLWDVEYEVLRRGSEKSYREKVRSLVSEYASKFDIVIVDCPPGKLIAAEEALLNSNIVLCPIVPERLSVWGMDKMREYFDELDQNHDIPPWKFVVSKFVGRTKESKKQIEHIESEYKDHFLREKKRFRLGEREFIGIKQTEKIIQRIAMFQDNPDNIKRLEQFYGDEVTNDLRKIAKEVASTGA